MPAPSWEVSVAWLCLCPFAVVTDILALAVLSHFRPIQQSVDVALASLFVTMAMDALLLLPFPALIRLAGDLRWTKDACTFYNWLSATLRASNILTLLLLNFYWVSSLRTSPDPSAQLVRPGRIFASSKLMKMAVSIAWVISIIIGMVPVAGETRVFDYYYSDPYGQRCWFLPYNSDIGFSLFFVIIALVCLLISLISAGDTLLLFRQMGHYAVAKFNTGRRVSIPGHVTGVSQSDSPEGHPQHSELTVSRELCLVGFCITLCSAALNLLPFVISQFVQLTHGDYDHIAMETTLLWLLLGEALLVPHLLWMLSARYRHALRYLWRVYVLKDASAEEEVANLQLQATKRVHQNRLMSIAQRREEIGDATACTLQAFRMKAKDCNVQRYKNGSVTNQINGAAYNATTSNDNLQAKPGHSRSNGGGDPFIVQVTSPRPATTQVATSNGVLELDDGMAIVTSLPSRSGAMPLTQVPGKTELSPADKRRSHDHNIVEHVNILYEDESKINHISNTEVESYVKREAQGSTSMSPQGTWASRIAHKDSTKLGVSSVMSQSTPTTPTKSLGVSPIPPSRRKSPGGISSNSRVKRSSSATSRQEWKERMRKKHLPAIFVNTSFEEDNVDGSHNATHNEYRSRQSSSSTIAETPAIHNVNIQAEVIDLKTSQSLEKETRTPNGKKYTIQDSPVGNTVFINEKERDDYLQATSAVQVTPLTKQTTFENEGMSDMYEDGDIVDILDNNTSCGPHDFEEAKVNRVTTFESQGRKVLSSSDEKLIEKTKTHAENKYTDGIDNQAFSLGVEENLLPGSADPGVFYDDTLISSLSQTPCLDQSTALTIPGPNASQQQRVEVQATTLAANESLSTLSRHTSPSTTLQPSHKRQTLNSASNVLVSSVDERVQYEPERENSQSLEIKVAEDDQKLFDVRGTSRNMEGLKTFKDENQSEFSCVEGLHAGQALMNVEPGPVTQDWSQLESVSDSEMMLFKTSQVTPAAAVVLESSLDEEDEDPHDKDCNANGTQEEGNSDPDGGRRVDEEEWGSVSPANLASFSTRENLNEVGQVDFAVGSYDLISSSPQDSPILRERSGQGDGAESEFDSPSSASSAPSSGEKVGSTINVSYRDPRLGIKLPAIKDLSEAKASDTNSHIFNRSTETFNTPEYKSTPVDTSGVSQNTVFDSQDSISDSVFGSDIVYIPKVYPPLASIIHAKNKDSLGVSPSKNGQLQNQLNSRQPSEIQSTASKIPKPLPSMNPTLPPTQKPPRGVGRRNRFGPDTIARITSSEDELDEIFVGDQKMKGKSDLAPIPHISDDMENTFDRSSSKNVDDSHESNNLSNSTNTDTSINLGSSKTILSVDQASIGNEIEGHTQSLSVESSQMTNPHSISILGKEDSVTLEPYGKRIPQWLQDVKSYDPDSSLPWLTSDGVSNSQYFGEGSQIPKLNLEEENVVFVDKIPDDYSSNLKVHHQHNPQGTTDLRNPHVIDAVYSSQYPTLSVNPTANTAQPYRAEEYKLDSIDIDEPVARTQPRYKKNTRPSSSRPMKRDLAPQNHTYQYDNQPPPPPYFSSHDYITPKVQISHESSLTQYHFDDDIDRGFEEALSMDYHPFAPLAVSSHMSSLYAPTASSGLYFESISEEPEESLSLTEMAEASSLNGDSIFKTQAVISRPSSRASFAALSDPQQPDNPDMPLKSSETLPFQSTSDPHPGQASDSQGSGQRPGPRGQELFRVEFVQTSERTSADGSETVEPPKANGSHAQQLSYDSYSSAPAIVKPPWGFEDTTSFFNEQSNAGEIHVNSVYGNDPFEEPFALPKNEIDPDTSSPWLNLDITVTNGPDPKEENPLDMSFGSDFSSEHTLAESFSKDFPDTNDYEYELKKSLEMKSNEDLYTEFERGARPSTPQQFKNQSQIDLDNHDLLDNSTVSGSEHESNIPSAYF